MMIGGRRLFSALNLQFGRVQLPVSSNVVSSLRLFLWWAHDSLPTRSACREIPSPPQRESIQNNPIRLKNGHIGLSNSN